MHDDVRTVTLKHSGPAILSIDQAEALEILVQNMYRNNPESILTSHAGRYDTLLRTSGNWSGTFAPLRNLSMETLARALFHGYIVCKSPEDRARALFNQLDSKAKESVVEILDISGVFIKGVNNNE